MRKLRFAFPFVLSSLFPAFANAASWETPVECSYDPAGSPFPEIEIRRAFESAKRTWETGTAVSLTYAGTIEAAGFKPCMLRWREQPIDNFAAYEQKITAGTAILASTITFVPSRVQHINTLTRLMVHELGHTLGLEHMNAAEVMYPFDVRHGITVTDIPNVVDVAAVTKLYPARVVNGKPVLDCRPRLYGVTIFLPVIDGYWTGQLAASTFSSNRADLRWMIDELRPLHELIRPEEFHLC